MKNGKKVKVVLTEKALKDIFRKEEERDLELEVNDYESYNVIMNAAEETLDGGIVFKIQQ